MGLIVFLGLLVVAVPLIALVLALSTRSQVRELREKVEDQSRLLSAALDKIAADRKGVSPSPSAEQEAGETETAAPAADAQDEDADEPEDAGPASAQDDQPDDAAPSGPWRPAAADAASAARVWPAPKRSLADLERLIGARWSVILGGVATALGAVLLVRATIEAGLLGPAARLVLAGLFSAALFAAGEWLRRHDRRFAIPAPPKADIPAILTGAGSIGAFATIYAAYALYGFIGLVGAFIGLTVVGLASLALSAVHGPAIAALGVLGSYATPLLVSSASPNLIALAIHVVVVTASICAIAVLREWLWLAFCGVAGGVAWTILAATAPGSLPGISGLLMLVGLALTVVATFAWSRLQRPAPLIDQPVERPAMVALLALLAAFFFQAVANQDLPQPIGGMLVTAIVLAAAVYWPALAPAAMIAAAIALVSQAALDVDLRFLPGADTLDELRAGLLPSDIRQYLIYSALLLAPPVVAAAAAALRYGAAAPRLAGWLAGSAGIVAFLGIVIAYLRMAPFETNIGFGLAGAVLALGAAGLVESATRLRPQDMAAPAPAAFAAAGIALLSFALAVTLDTGWLPLAFALASAGIAYVYGFRPLAALPWLAAGAGALGALSLWASLPFDPETIGTTPFFNRLILLVGVPSLALLFAGEWFRRLEAERPGAVVSALGLAAAGLFVALQIRHWLNGGRLDGGAVGLDEMAAHAIAALAFSIGLQRLARLTGASIYSGATLVAGGLSALTIAFGLLIAQNPLLSSEPVGATPVFNLLLPGYLLPALLAAIVALQARYHRPRWYVLGFAALAGLLLFAFVSLTVRHGFQGEILSIARQTGDAEFWTYSAVWLLMGVGVLAIGHWLQSFPVRAASGALIALTVCKVFLFDMAALTGAMRAFSFIGLGLSLLAIGRFYQFLLRPAPGEPQDEDNARPGPETP